MHGPESCRWTATEIAEFSWAPGFPGYQRPPLARRLWGMKWISAVCPHDVAVRPSDRGPEWFCRECGWALPLYRDRCGAIRAVNAALVRATRFVRHEG